MKNPAIESALELQAFCKRQKWRFCFIGGIAVQRWSEPRFTKVTSKQSLITCCAEDLVTHKAFASRTKDWLDVETILMRQRGKLNFDLIWRELRPLIELKEAPEIEEQLKKLIAKVDRIGL